MEHGAGIDAVLRVDGPARHQADSEWREGLTVKSELDGSRSRGNGTSIPPAEAAASVIGGLSVRSFNTVSEYIVAGAARRFAPVWIIPALVGIVSGGANSFLTDFTHLASRLGARIAVILKTPGRADLFPEK